MDRNDIEICKENLNKIAGSVSNLAAFLRDDKDLAEKIWSIYRDAAALNEAINEKFGIEEVASVTIRLPS